MVGDQTVYQFDTRKGFGITLLAGAIIALAGCSAETDPVADAPAETTNDTTSSATSGSPASLSSATAMAASASANDPAAEAERRRRFEEASRASLDRASEGSTADAATAPKPKPGATPNASVTNIGARPSAPIASASGSTGIGATAAPAKPAAVKPAPSANIAMAPAAAPAAFNMTGGSADDGAVIAAPPAAPAVAGAAAPTLSNSLSNATTPAAAAQIQERQTQQREVLTDDARSAKNAALAARRAAREAGEPLAPGAEQAAIDRARVAVQAADRAAGREPAPVPVRVQSPGDAAPATGVTLEPAILEYGDIPLGDSKKLVVKIVNNSDREYRLIDCRATCGCTTTQCPKGGVMAPNGGFVEVEVQLDGGERATRLRKTVNFLISDGHPPLRLALDATAVSYISVTPERLDRGQHPDGAITIRATDGTPFKVLSMFPAVLTPDEMPQEAKAVQVINVPWDKLYESGSRQRRLLFRLDHPKAERALVPLSVNVLRDMREREGAAGPADQVARPAVSTGRDLNQMLARDEIDAVLAMVAADEVAINQPDQARHTPMIKAARYGAVEVIMALSDKGSNLEATDGMGRTPISYAAQSGNLDAVLTLLDLGANVNHVDQTGNTPLGWAAGFGTVGMCEEMIDAGANVNSGSGTLIGFTPLIWAAMTGTEPDKVKLLIERGADLEARDTMEQATVLMHAIRTNMMKNVEVLMDAGSKVDVTDAKGRTPLHVAASNGAPDVKMIEFLLAKGLNPHALTRKNEKPVDLARKRKDSKAPAVIAALEAAMVASSRQGNDG